MTVLKFSEWLLESMKKVFTVLLFFFVHSAIAGTVQTGKVTKLAINKDIGSLVFVYTDAAKDSTPACHANSNWRYVLSLNSELDRNLFSMLLAAKASGAKVRLVGSSSCDVFSSIESLRYVELFE